MPTKDLTPVQAKAVSLALQKRQTIEQGASLGFTADVAPVATELGLAADVQVSYRVLPSGSVTATWPDEPAQEQAP